MWAVLALSGIACIAGSSRSSWRRRRRRQQQPPAAPLTPGQAGPDQGRGGRGGRGGAGGPGATDPANADADFAKQPPVLPLPAAEQQKQFVLQPGYRIAPVLTEPDIKEPGAIAFDGNGRMFVLELRGYMQDADATGELDPVGRISRHEDADNDGVYERHTVFVDKLVFPRFVMPFGANSVLTMESNADEVWQFTDTNNDGVADKKELFTSNFGRSGNVEHQQAFLYWGMDNWLYSTVNAFRVRWTPNGVIREPTGPNGAQWGATQDNDGKMWFQGGASGLPSFFQFPGPLRQLHRRRSVREGLRDSVGRAGSRRGHAARACAPCGCRTDRSTESRDRPATTSIAETASPPISSATTSTASRSAASSGESSPS